MCGIAGIFRPGAVADDLGVVRRMLEVLKVRGPDGEGVFREDRLTLGHRRLAILDLSETGRQPMESAGGRYVVAFNGEIYNYRDLVRELDIPRQSLRSSSDTEVLLLAWERWGAACLDKLVGQWAFAIYDRRDEALWLVRDRFGEKPLFYHETPGALAFASTLASLVSVPWVSRDLSPEALGEFLTLRYVISPRTLLREVRKIPPGHYLRVDRHGQRIVGWWSPRFHGRAERHPALSRREAEDRFGADLVQAVRRCVVSDVPVGLLLSDGIDSHGILSALQHAGIDCPTYTYEVTSGPATNGGERSPATGGATRSNLIRVTFEEITRDLEPAFGSMAEPIGDGVVLATYHLIRQARSQATVFLAGHGADELLGGYRLSQDRFRLAAMRRLCRAPLPQLDALIESYTNGEEPARVRRAALVHAAPRQVPEAAHYLIQRPLPAPELRALFAPLPPPGRYLGTIERLYADCETAATDLDRMQEVALRSFLSEHVLSVADSSAMASSAESRLPYLDRDLADLVFDLPPSMRVSRWPGVANTKLMLRSWAKRRMPREVLTRKKNTFRYGSIGAMLKVRGRDIRSMVLDCPPLRRHLGGLESWMGRPPEVYRRGLEGTYWALLAFALWSGRAGVT
jgi:asparagine synthase (glutamine-hydrolysing)